MVVLPRDFLRSGVWVGLYEFLEELESDLCRLRLCDMMLIKL